MTTSRSAGIVLVAALSLGSASIVEAEKKDFDARWKAAETNVRTGAGKQYFGDVFFKEFFGKYTVHVNECTRRTGEKIRGELKAAVELGARGQVLAVLVRPDSKPSRCFADLVKGDTFSPPPSGHFWVPVLVKFTGE
jgi:hypothetical protein